MKKSILFVITALLSANFINAQKSELMKLGLKAGINYANYTGSDVNTDAITNFHAGLVLEIKVLKNFSFQPELLYSTQGAEVDNLGEQFKNELGYISIPLLAKFNLNDNLSLELGPQASFLLSERNEVEAGDSNTFDFAVTGGLSYKLGKHFFVQGRYGLGLTEPKRDADVKNSVLQASIGYMF
ncbi:porin family protein [Flavobacterium sp.]|uniref:porin family protein n=1 Tax=Flavobacterium sp. TaxID=239 RepID=UPI00262D249A|nr:porin family protein [Flavobacterium sp.]